MRARAGSAISPCSTGTSPPIARNSVVLPTPLRPTSPTRAPSGMRAEAPSSSSLPATRTVTSSITSMRAFWPTGRRDATARYGCCAKPMTRIIILVPVGAREATAELGRISMCVPGCQETLHQALRAGLSRRRFFKGAAASFAAVAASEPAQAAPRHFRRTVDLTHTMSPDFPTFFGVPGIEMEKKFDLKKDGFNLNWWRIIEHAGTHLDAPIHFSEDGITAEKISAETLVVPLAVIDVVAKAASDPDYQVTREDIRAWERRHGRLPANSCVAMHAGWARHVGDAAKFTGKDAGGVFHFPGFSGEAAEWLLRRRRVAGLAVDTMSLDHGPSKDFKTHRLWLPSGRWGLECVANLDQVPAAGATLVVGLAKVKDATGGPARLIALV